MRTDLWEPVLAAVDDHWRTEYRPPTIREIMNMVGVNSSSVVAKVLRELASTDQLHMSGQDGDARRAVPLWIVRLVNNSP